MHDTNIAHAGHIHIAQTGCFPILISTRYTVNGMNDHNLILMGDM